MKALRISFSENARIVFLLVTLDNGIAVYRIYLEKLLTDAQFFDDEENVS